MCPDGLWWKTETCTHQWRLAANIDEDTIEQIGSYKYLRVKLYETMDWSDYIDYIHSNVAKRLELLNALSIFFQLMLEKLCINDYNPASNRTGTLSGVVCLIKQK